MFYDLYRLKIRERPLLISFILKLYPALLFRQLKFMLSSFMSFDYSLIKILRVFTIPIYSSNTLIAFSAEIFNDFKIIAYL